MNHCYFVCKKRNDFYFETRTTCTVQVIFFYDFVFNNNKKNKKKDGITNLKKNKFSLQNTYNYSFLRIESGLGLTLKSIVCYPTAILLK